MVKALLFDVFGTVVDWRTGVAGEVARFCAARGLAVDAWRFADAWRARYQPAMQAVRSGNRGYVPLDIMHRENLDATLSQFGLADAVTPDERADLNRAWERLPPWPDSVPGLTALKSRHAIAACSNGSIALMVRLARFAGLPWDTVLGAEIARDYKPQAAVYLASASALGLLPQEVMMVAAHNDDLAAARACGLGTAFVPRTTEHGPHQSTDLHPDASWDIVATDLEDLARQLGAGT